MLLNNAKLLISLLLASTFFGQGALAAIRINCGATDNYVDTNGNTWVPDEDVARGGVPKSYGGEIANTIEQGLFQTWREEDSENPSNILFAIRMPAEGDYTVKLYFMESEHNRGGQRDMDIFIEGSRIVNDLDVWAEAPGRFGAHVVERTVAVAGSVLSVRLTSKTGLSAISGIAVFAPGEPETSAPSPLSALETSAPTFTPTLLPSLIRPTEDAIIRINCGSTENYVDTDGNTWVPDGAFTKKGVPKSYGGEIANTIEQGLFQTWREEDGANPSNVLFAIHMPEGDYTVKLYFMESEHSRGGQRDMDIYIEGSLIVNDLDVWAEAPGRFRAHVVEQTVTVSGWVMSVRLTSKTGLSAISGIAVFAPGESESSAPTYAPTMQGTAAPTMAAPLTQQPTLPRAVGGYVLEDQKILLADSTSDDNAGRRMASDGDTLVIGAYREDGDFDRQGAVYIYQWEGDAWVFNQKLVSESPGLAEAFGTVVAIENDTIIVGNRGDSEFFADGGAAWIYRLIGNEWRLAQKIVPADVSGDMDFGTSVEISGNLLAIGARDNQFVNGGGVVYIYRHNPVNSQFEFLQRIVPDEVVEFYRFGNWNSVAISGTTLVIGGDGAPNVDGHRVGAVHVYELEDGLFQQQAKIMLEDGVDLDRFGGAVALDGDLIVVSAVYFSNRKGSVYVYSQSAAYTLVQTLAPWKEDADAGFEFGSSMKAGSGTIAVGAMRGTGRDSSTGTAYFFTLNESSQYVQRAIMMASDGERNARLGEGITITGGRVAASAPSANTSKGDKSGAIYTFDLSELV